ncbi:MAG: MerR family transcriptional regulator [Clostridia bacterium]|nr:MerR family transcriptional regulator [Clostridia bacterium]
MTIREVSEKYGVSADTLRYYEKMGMIPPVTRNASGIRDYTAEDLRWVELAKCMRASGLSVEAMVQYVQLFQQGDETIPERLSLLLSQRAELLEKREKIDAALLWLERKIERYEAAAETGVLKWTDE